MNDVYNELLQIAEDELSRIISTLPEDPILSNVILIEAIRTYDYNGIAKSINGEIDLPDFYLVRMGWNLCCSYLFKRMNSKGFPLMESTRETRMQSLSLLYNLGSIIMLRRATEMIKSGHLHVEKKGNTYNFRKTELADLQYIDKLSFPNLEKLEKKINSVSNYNNWNVTKQDNIFNVINLPGNFIGIDKDNNDFKEYELKDIDAKMLPLIFPWHSGRGIMMGYNTTEEIDFHFLAKAYPLVLSWRAEAGIHPSTDFKKFNGSDLTAVVLVITSIYLKHEHFTSLASKKHSEISIQQSLTTWLPFDEFINSISHFTGIVISKVSEILNTIALKAEDIMFLRNHTSIFMPLLIDLGNGYIIKPISSILTNPFFSIISLLEYKTPHIRHNISKHREEWMRNEIYSLFLGERYIRVEGNVNLKDAGKIVTDIDGAVYDKFTGQLAIIQIKWQDFFINDVKKLKSKANNLCKGFDEWATKVDNWINDNGLQELSRNLRLGKGNTITSFYLFGISRTVSHTEGYGYKSECQNIAISNMPQFVKCRFETGPTDMVIQKLFQELKTSSETFKTIPLPFEYTISNFNFHFEDLFCTLDE